MLKCPFLTSVEWESKHGVASRDQSEIPYWIGTTLTKLFSPLLSHPTIRRFSVGFTGFIVPCTPTDFRVVARAWPDLQTFRLYHHTGACGRSVDPLQYSDVGSLLAFARLRPHLRNLHIPKLVFNVNSREAAVEVAPHALGALWITRLEVFFSGGRDHSDGHREGLTQFRGWAERVFPFAMIHIPSSI